MKDDDDEDGNAAEPLDVGAVTWPSRNFGRER